MKNILKTICIYFSTIALVYALDITLSGTGLNDIRGNGISDVKYIPTNSTGGGGSFSYSYTGDGSLTVGSSKNAEVLVVAGGGGGGGDSAIKAAKSVKGVP